MSTEVARDLRKLSKVWQATEAKKPGKASIPDGEYIGELVSMVVGHSKKGNRLQVAEQWKILSGKHKGALVSQYHGLESDDNIGYFKGHAEVLGIEMPDDMEELPDALEGFVDGNTDTFRLILKTNEGGFQNVNALGVSDEADAGSTDGADDEDSADGGDADDVSDADDQDDDPPAPRKASKVEQSAKKKRR